MRNSLQSPLLFIARAATAIVPGQSHAARLGLGRGGHYAPAAAARGQHTTTGPTALLRASGATRNGGGDTPTSSGGVPTPFVRTLAVKRRPAERLTVVLDMDECLIHSKFEPLDRRGRDLAHQLMP